MATRSARNSAPGPDPHDITVYPVEEKMGEDLLHIRIMELLRPLVERWLAERGVKAATGANQFIYFRRGDTRGRVAPDVFVLPGVEPRRWIKSWKVWEEGVVPSFALEVVSSDVDKEYIDAPVLYRELGVRELVIFDPDFDTGLDEARFRFQVYRRVARRGLVRVLVTNEDRVVSRELGCHVRAVGAGGETLLHLATGANGEELYPPSAEAERVEKEHERAEKERECAEKERERAEKERECAEKERECAEKEHERAMRLAAEEELRKLRLENERLRGRIRGRR